MKTFNALDLQVKVLIIATPLIFGLFFIMRAIYGFSAW